MAIYSWFTRKKWWCSIVFCMFTRGLDFCVWPCSISVHQRLSRPPGIPGSHDPANGGRPFHVCSMGKSRKKRWKIMGKTTRNAIGCNRLVAGKIMGKSDRNGFRMGTKPPIIGRYPEGKPCMKRCEKAHWGKPLGQWLIFIGGFSRSI